MFNGHNIDVDVRTLGFCRKFNGASTPEMSERIHSIQTDALSNLL